MHGECWQKISGGTGTRSSSQSVQKWDKGFSSFFAKFYDALRNFEKSSNMTKIWQKLKKFLFDLLSTPFTADSVSEYLKIGFWVPAPTLDETRVNILLWTKPLHNEVKCEKKSNFKCDYLKD